MAIIKANATYTRTFLAVYKTDHVTGATGITVIVRLSKAGAAYGASAGSVAQVGNGLFSISLTTADTNTLGDLAYNCTGTNIDPTDFIDQVVNFDFNVPVVTTGTTVGTVTLAGGTYAVNLSGSVNNVITGVTVTTNNDKTGYTASTVSDKTGYSLSSGTQTFNQAGTQSGPFVSAISLASGTYAVNLSGSVNNVIQPISTTITGGTTNANVVQWVGVAPNSLISGRVDSNAQVVGDKTGYSLASGTQVGVIIPTVVSVNSVSGSVGSVTGAVGSVTGNVGGSVNSVVNSVVTGTNADKTGYSLLAGQLFVKKNTALANFMFLMLDSTDHVTPKTGLTVASQVSIDGAAFGNTANSVSEIGTGIYKISLANTDTNGTTLMFKFTATGADNRYIEIVTQT